MKDKHKGLIRNLYGATLYHTGVTGLYQRRNADSDQIWILGYHQMDRQAFEAHLKYFVENYTVVSLRSAYRMLMGEQAMAPNPLVLTFDDSHLSFYTEVFPLLQKYNTPATTFAATDFVGTGKLFWFDWVDAIVDQVTETTIEVAGNTYQVPEDDRFDLKETIQVDLKQFPEAEKLNMIANLADKIGFNVDLAPASAKVINWEQAAEMQSSGVVDIGGHTCSHPILTRISGEQARQEIIESREILQQNLDDPIEFFAYPNGGLQDINPEIISYVQEAGYLGAVTLLEGTCVPGDQPYTLKRISASDGFTYKSLAAKMQGLWRKFSPGFELETTPSEAPEAQDSEETKLNIPD